MVSVAPMVALFCSFQTHPCGVEVRVVVRVLDDRRRFRRTLVGLKSPRFGARRCFIPWFQTHPCGVEVSALIRARGATPQFQTHPCGVEVPTATAVSSRRSRFQTHPCGVEVRAATRRTGTHRRFQTHPCGVEVRSTQLWSLSTGGFRRTLVGLKYVRREPGRRSTPVSDAPLWG